MSKSEDTCVETPYGFNWGNTEIFRAAAVEERGRGISRALGIRTPYRRLDVQISPNGRSVRVFRDGVELK